MKSARAHWYRKPGLQTEGLHDSTCRHLSSLDMWAAFKYHKCLVCVKGWLAEAQEKKLVDWITIMLNKHPEKRAGMTYVSAMRFILATGLKGNCVSNVNQEYDIVGIAYSIAIHHLGKIQKDCIFRPLLVGISNQIFTSTRYWATATEKWWRLYRFHSRARCQVMVGARRWLCTTAGNQLNNTYESSFIGTITAWKSWSLRGGDGSVRSSSTSELIRCLHGSKRS